MQTAPQFWRTRKASIEILFSKQIANFFCLFFFLLFVLDVMGTIIDVCSRKVNCRAASRLDRKDSLEVRT